MALVALGFEGLRRQTAREYPGADRREARRLRTERMRGAFAGARRRAGEGSQAMVRQAVAVAGTATSELRARTGNGAHGPSPDDERLERLERLGRLRDAGTLDDAEFAAEKSRILGEDAAT